MGESVLNMGTPEKQKKEELIGNSRCYFLSSGFLNKFFGPEFQPAFSV